MQDDRPWSQRMDDLLDVRSYKALQEIIEMYGWERIESAFGALAIERAAAGC